MVIAIIEHVNYMYMYYTKWKLHVLHEGKTNYVTDMVSITKGILLQHAMIN